ncbi:MAG: 30S ribosome-binding factor RbfA [Lentisphaeraceae bacterium]|nr:30S ribosome-binding factor RbfA [Lentisphaeraceae bacterium]
MAKDRMRSVDATVKKELATLFSKDVFPSFSCLITLVDVKTSPDLKHCKVYVSVLGSETEKREVMAFLVKHTTEYYQYLGSRLRMKFTPMINWVFDDTAEKADKLSSILDNLDIPEEDQ